MWMFEPTFYGGGGCDGCSGGGSSGGGGWLGAEIVTGEEPEQSICGPCVWG